MSARTSRFLSYSFCSRLAQIVLELSRKSPAALRRVIVVLVQAPSKGLSRLSRKFSRSSPITSEVRKIRAERGKREGNLFADLSERGPIPIPELHTLQLPLDTNRPSSFDDSSGQYQNLSRQSTNRYSDTSYDSGRYHRPVSVQIHVTDLSDDVQGHTSSAQPMAVSSREPIGAEIIDNLSENSRIKQDHAKPSSSNITTKETPAGSKATKNYEVFIVENEDYKSFENIKEIVDMTKE